jgi:catechol 2,3-dioxygenase-like lactoylglutathione lyase family enzyme
MFKLTLDHVAISVKDVNRSADFYGRILKFQEITNQSKFEGIRWFSMGDGKELHLISIVKENVTLNKAIHLALTTPDFDAFVAMLEQMKIPYSDWPGAPNKVFIRADGTKQVFFQDLDDNWIEVNSVAQH